MTAIQATPGGKVAFIWGFSLGNLIVGGSTCNGLVLGIKPAQLLGVVTADMNGEAELIFFIPLLGNTALAYTQAVNIPICLQSDVIENILTNQ